MSSRNAWWQWAATLVVLAAPWSASAAMQAKPVEWKIGQDTYSGVLVYDDSEHGKRPGLVMVPNWRGVNASAIEKAKRIAGDDYVVLVADVYGKGVRPKDDQEAGQIAGKLRGDRQTLRARGLKAVEVLKAQAQVDPNRIGALGFCFGGTTVLELARAGAPLDAVVSLHGALSTDLPAQSKAVKAPVLVLNGADDRSVTAEDIAAFQKEMDAGGADWQFVNFSGAVHCFAEADANSPPGCLYNERAARRAYRIMEGFLEERFGD